MVAAQQRHTLAFQHGHQRPHRIDIGLAPGTSITGFPPGTVVSGAIQINNAAALQAKTDIDAAFTAINALPQPSPNEAPDARIQVVGRTEIAHHQLRIADGIGPWLYHLTLPAITLSLIYIALIARVTRASVLETLGEDYIRTARAKGIRESAVLLRHALANAAVPIVTVVGIGVALLIGGVVVTETVFAIPGLGSLTVDAVLNRDFPVIQGLVLLFSLSYVGINLLVDTSYLWLDPRIRH